MKNIATKIIYYVLFATIFGLVAVFVGSYKMVAEANPTSTISSVFALLIALVIIGCVVGSVLWAISFYKGGDVSKAKKDVEVILGNLMQKWNLDYNNQLLLILDGQNQDNVKLQISFIPLPVRAGFIGFNLIYPYQGVALSTVVLNLGKDVDQTRLATLKGKLEQLAANYNGKVTVSGSKLVYMAKNKGEIDSNKHQNFFNALDKIL